MLLDSLTAHSFCAVFLFSADVCTPLMCFHAYLMCFCACIWCMSLYCCYLCFSMFLFIVLLHCPLIPLVFGLLVAVAIGCLLLYFLNYITCDVHSLSVASCDQWGCDRVWGCWVIEYPFAFEVVWFLFSPILVWTIVIALKFNVRGRDKDIGKVKSRKSKKHWAIADKKLFIELALEQIQKATCRARSSMQLDERIHLRNLTWRWAQNMFLQFENLYGQLRESSQTWKSSRKNTGLGYDSDPKAFTLDDNLWNEMIKVYVNLFLVSFCLLNEPLYLKLFSLLSTG